VLDIIAPEDEILLTVITAIAHQTEPLPPAITTQLQQLGQISPSQLTDAVQDFLDELDYQPLRESVNAIEKQLLANPNRSAPPPQFKPEHSKEIFNHFNSVVRANDPIKAAQTLPQYFWQQTATRP
jgi:hypothetical protein